MITTEHPLSILPSHLQPFMVAAQCEMAIKGREWETGVPTHQSTYLPNEIRGRCGRWNQAQQADHHFYLIITFTS